MWTSCCSSGIRPMPSLSQTKAGIYENLGRKQGRKKVRQEGRKQGKKEGRKEGKTTEGHHSMTTTRCQATAALTEGLPALDILELFHCKVLVRIWKHEGSTARNLNKHCKMLLQITFRRIRAHPAPWHSAKCREPFELEAQKNCICAAKNCSKLEQTKDPLLFWIRPGSHRMSIYI